MSSKLQKGKRHLIGLCTIVLSANHSYGVAARVRKTLLSICGHCVSSDSLLRLSGRNSTCRFANFRWWFFILVTRCWVSAVQPAVHSPVFFPAQSEYSLPATILVEVRRPAKLQISVVNRLEAMSVIIIWDCKEVPTAVNSLVAAM